MIKRDGRTERQIARRIGDEDGITSWDSNPSLAFGAPDRKGARAGTVTRTRGHGAMANSQGWNSEALDRWNLSRSSHAQATPHGAAT